jgi:hypothetical protein
MTQANPHIVLHKIPVTPWVLGTVEKMHQAGTSEVTAWNRYWLQTYRELGGQSHQSGSKGCPRAAAYGLWMLGRLRGGGRATQVWTVDRVKRELGKNAAYAVIAADLLAQGATTSLGELWPIVQAQYTAHTSDEPAGSEQGEVKMVIALFCEQQLIGP